MMKSSRRGGALVVAIVTLMVVMLLAGTVARSLVAAHRQSRRVLGELQAQWLADAAIARGLAQVRSHAEYTGETWRPAISVDSIGVAEIRVERPADSPGGAKLVVVARYPDDPTNRAVVSRELLVERTEESP